MNEMSLESFINFCEDMEIVEESVFNTIGALIHKLIQRFKELIQNLFSLFKKKNKENEKSQNIDDVSNQELLLLKILVSDICSLGDTLENVHNSVDFSSIYDIINDIIVKMPDSTLSIDDFRKTHKIIEEKTRIIINTLNIKKNKIFDSLSDIHNKIKQIDSEFGKAEIQNAVNSKIEEIGKIVDMIEHDKGFNDLQRQIDISYIPDQNKKSLLHSMNYSIGNVYITEINMCIDVVQNLGSILKI